VSVRGTDGHRSLTILLALAMIVLGTLLLGRTIGEGGRADAVGVILGGLFIAAGAARLWSQRRPR
jgi:hypothetical protein